MEKVIVVGGGPAGVSAAIYAARSGIETMLIGAGSSALEKAEKIENYYGFEHPVNGRELAEAGLAQARRLGVTVLEDEVVGISYDESFVVRTAEQAYPAGSVILATGSARATPPIEGASRWEGKGISYCAVCDAFFYRGKDVGVVGHGDYALAEAMELLPVAKSVTLLTNGKEPLNDIPPEIRVVRQNIAEIIGGDRLEKVVFENGEHLEVSGLFIAVGVASSSDLARTLGVATADRTITVGPLMETNLPGLYAAGDCTGGLLQIAKAVYEGAVAGLEAVKFLRKKT